MKKTPEERKEIEERNIMMGANADKIDKFVTFVKVGLAFILGHIGLFSFLVILIAFAFIITSFRRPLEQLAPPPDATKYLSDIYRGEKFEILEQNTDEEGYGYYKMCPKQYPEIQFHAYRDKEFGTKDDYYARAYRYWLQSYPDQELVKNFRVNEEMQTINDTEFLKFEVYRDIESYDEIEQVTRQMYELVKYLENQDSRCYFYMMITDGKFNNSIRCHENNGYEDFLNRTRYEYIEFWGSSNERLKK